MINRTWIPAKQIAGTTILLISSAMFVFAQPSVSIRSEASPKEIYIGDPIAVNFIITASSDVTLQPVRVSTAMEPFELLAAASPTFTAGKDGKSTVVFRFLLTTFSTGPATIPAFPLQFASASGDVTEAKTEPISINVKSLLAEKGDEGNIRPLKGLFDFKSYLWVWILLGILAAFGIGYASWKYSSKLGGGLRLETEGPPRPAEELAWEAIHRLEDEELIAAGHSKEFYYRLSVILREYLERRYEMSALDRTTSELLADFRRREFPLTLAALCRDFFEDADLVKFAKFTPDEAAVEKDLNQVKQFINLTTPKKEAKPEEDMVKI